MSPHNPLTAIVNANIETLDQGIGFLNSITENAYSSSVESPIKGKIGSHVRHMADLYRALIIGYDSGEIDFNFRRRDAELEINLQAGNDELNQIREWLIQLNQQRDRKLCIITEVSLSQTHSVSLPSSLARELVFTSSHAVHHFAQIAILARIQGFTVDGNLGLAANTASYRRDMLVAI